MFYGIEIKIGSTWEPARPPTEPPYSFKTAAEAETMARVLYPTEFTNPNAVRIVPKEEA